MHARTSTPPTACALQGATRGLHPPRRRGLGAMARHVAVDLTPQAVEQVAVRVAQLLQRQQQNQAQRHASESTGMLTVAELAQHLHLNRAWVYEHADELGAIRVGSGPKARIRFDLHTAKGALQQHHVDREPVPAGARPHKPRRRPQADLYSPDAPLLESRPRQIRGVRSCFAPRRGGMRLI
jgi:hypothetical protein